MALEKTFNVSIINIRQKRVLDKRGCAVSSQNFHGPFGKPQIGKVRGWGTLYETGKNIFLFNYSSSHRLFYAVKLFFIHYPTKNTKTITPNSIISNTVF